MNSVEKAAGGGRSATLRRLIVLAVALVVLVATWARLFEGMLLEHEGATLVVPWRWALGDRPFLDEQNLAQIPSLLLYPFIKLFALITAGDPGGLVLYGRHLSLLLTVIVALTVVVCLRGLVRWETALLISLLGVVFSFRATAQVGSAAVAANLLLVSAALGVRGLFTGGRRWPLASGITFGLALVALPTFLFVAPFYGVFLAFAHGSNLRARISRVPPALPAGATGRAARRAVVVWAAGAGAVLAVISLVVLSFGVDDLQRCWRFTISNGRAIGQLGGAGKFYEIIVGGWNFFWAEPVLLVAAALLLAVFYRWPTVGRALLVGIPLALWRWSLVPGVEATGFILAFALMAPYLYVFVPPERRPAGAQLLVWLWAPAVLGGAMAAATSSLGFAHAAVGLFPASLASGIFAAWSLEAVRPAKRPSLGAVLVVVTLVLIVAVPLGSQIVGMVRLRSAPVARCATGPWSGVLVAAGDERWLDTVAADLARQRRPEDELLIYPGGSALYLFWPGTIAANSYWIRASDGSLPRSTIDEYERRRRVPSLIMNLATGVETPTGDRPERRRELRYKTVVARQSYTISRRPKGMTVDQVLSQLSR